MKLWKKISLAVLIVIVLSQVPFAYRRHRLSRLSEAIRQLNSQRLVGQTGNYIDHRGVIHVHSFLGGHSSGSFQEIVQAAQANGLQFVVMTEHPGRELDTAEMTLKGEHDGVLFVNGNEVATSEGDRFLLAPGDSSTGRSHDQSTEALVGASKAAGKLIVVAYPGEFRNWQSDGFDALEVYNLYTNARRVNPIVTFFDTLWSDRSNHDLLFANFYARPSEELKKWDEINRKRKIVALAGNDAHSNIGLTINDASGKTVFGFKLDPYATSFHLVRVHVLLPKDQTLDTATLITAIREGHCFIGFDVFGDPAGFSFNASNSIDQRIQGDEIPLRSDVRLSVTTPIAARIVLLKDGSVIADETNKTSAEFVVTEKGTYRVEVYLPQLGNRVAEQPWIISNPIYVV